jgi:hypothetical protein
MTRRCAHMATGRNLSGDHGGADTSQSLLTVPCASSHVCTVGAVVRRRGCHKKTWLAKSGSTWRSISPGPPRSAGFNRSCAARRCGGPSAAPGRSAPALGSVTRCGKGVRIARLPDAARLTAISPARRIVDVSGSVCRGSYTRWSCRRPVPAPSPEG